MSAAVSQPARAEGADNAAEAFIARWDGTTMAERANRAPFLSELCDVLGLPRPDPASGSGSGSDYRFERGVTRQEDDGSTSSRRIDLYRRGCFVCEAKQGATPHRQPNLLGDSEAQRRANIRNTPAWVRHMQKAKGQAEGYARDLPPDEGWPPFLIVCDVGFCLDLYADFSSTGKHYAQFPDRERFRIYLPDLRRADIRALLRRVWLDPRSLDPALRRAEVTQDIAALLARLATALERRHAPAHVATFLMRCIFCMFAQSAWGCCRRRASASCCSGAGPTCRGSCPSSAISGKPWAWAASASR